MKPNNMTLSSYGAGGSD
jgi:hypothetical protein